MMHTLQRRPRTPLVIDPKDPRAVGVCDGCGFWLNYKDLRKDMQYRGGSVPVWTGFLVCDKCLDVPNPAPQFKRLVLPPDPVPVENPRPEVPTPTLSGFNYLVTETGAYFNTLNSADTWGGDFFQTIPDAGTT